MVRCVLLAGIRYTCPGSHLPLVKDRAINILTFVKNVNFIFLHNGAWRKMHEAGILKLEKTNIQAWKDKGVLPEEIAERPGMHRLSIYCLVPKARNLPSLVTPPSKEAQEDQEKWWTRH